MDNEQENFYFNGYVNIKLHDSLSFRDLKIFLRNADLIDLHSSQDWKEVYPETFDLKDPKKIEYDFFLKFLFEGRIFEKIEKITGYEMVLGDFAIRKTYNEDSYMAMHRDTYLNKHGSLVGRIPPLFKLIFYPSLSAAPEAQLSVIPGSHLKYNKNYILDKTYSILARKKIIHSSDTSCLFFNSAIFHAVHPVKKVNGQFRCIFNFCLKSQIKQFSAGLDIQKKLNAIKPI
jgi:Rps23 Pro-64 3,4-dihydroxylase Tpa1-like proline 4-hydroxylase